MRYAKVIGTTFTAIGLASAITACASPGGEHAVSAFNSASPSKIALATRAQAALGENDLANAVKYAEQAVEQSPNDAGFRKLLGNTYLASGRYGSAEAAYTDALRLYANQPDVVLKLALVEIALGHKSSAIELLQSAGDMVEPADRGLALALAGEPAQAVELLEAAAHQPYADARLRQNLALAHALNNDWDAARIVAAQDLPADQVDQRMTQWMAYAAPDKADTRVASFIGIARSPADPGQPTRLALGGARDDVRTASLAPAPTAIAAPPAPVQVAQAHAPAPVPVATPVQFASAPVSAPAAAPVEVAMIEPLAPPPPPPRVVSHKAPSTVTVDLPAPRPVKLAAAAVKPARKAPRPALSRAASPVDPSLVRKAAFGNSNAVVQLGAYSSRERVELAWNKAVDQYSSLKGLMPVTARFDGSKGSVYRLSVKGFASDREAARFCGSLKAVGRSCFVRHASGDAPVSFASR